MAQVKKLSMMVMLSAALVFLIVAAAGLIGYISLRNGKRAVEDLAAQLQAQILSSIQEKLGDYLAMPHRLNRLNADILVQNPAMIEDLERLQPVYIRQLKAFDFVTTVAIGIEQQGNYVGVGRREDGYFGSGLVNQAIDSVYRLYLLDDQGQVIRLLTETPDYDARTRPWYISAVQAGKAVWSPIYIFASGLDIGITAVLPIYDHAGNLIAVHQSALTLDFISNFLNGLQIGKSGQVFLIEQDGMVVASSTSEKVIRKGDKDFERFQATESADPFIRTASAYFRSQFGTINHIPDTFNSNITINGRRYLLSAAKLHDPHGLNWIMIVGLPESDVMEQIDANTRTTVLLCIIASLTAIWLGMIITHRLTSTNQRLELEIAERIQIETALREREALFHGMFDTHSAVMFLLDPANGRILEANQAAVRYYGYSREELQTISIYAINQLDRTAVDQIMNQAKAQQRDHFEFRHRLANGDIRDVEVHTAPVTWQHQTILFSIIHDITARKQAEEALRESEQKYRLLAENVTDVIWTLDFQGRFTYVSPSVKRLRGYTPEEVMQQTLAEALCPGSIEIAVAGLRQTYEMVRTGQQGIRPHRHELEQPCKDGTTVWTEAITSRMYNEQGEFIGILGVTRDISERKRMEAEVVQAKERAEAAERLKSTFFANVSHHLRTPLNVILGFADLMAEDTALSPTYQEYLTLIRQNGKDLLALLNQMLKVAKLDPKEIMTDESSRQLFDLLENQTPQATLTPQPESILGEEEIEALQNRVQELSADVRRRFADATQHLDIALMSQIINQIRQNQPALADTLERLARNFEYETLLNTFNLA